MQIKLLKLKVESEKTYDNLHREAQADFWSPIKSAPLQGSIAMHYFDFRGMIFKNELNMFAVSKTQFKRPCTVECEFRAASNQTMFVKLSLFGGFGYSICLANLNFSLSPNIVKFMKDNQTMHELKLNFTACLD